MPSQGSRGQERRTCLSDLPVSKESLMPKVVSFEWKNLIDETRLRPDLQPMRWMGESGAEGKRPSVRNSEVALSLGLLGLPTRGSAFSDL